MNKKFANNDIIFRQGDAADCMYEITAGSVGIYANYGMSNEKLLTTLSVGVIFGEMGMIEKLPRSATAVALEEGAEVRSVTEEGFAAYFQSNPDKVLDIMKHMSGRIRGLTEDYLDACRAVAESEEAAQTGKRSGWLKTHVKKFVQDYADAVVYRSQNEDLFKRVRGSDEYFLL